MSPGLSPILRVDASLRWTEIDEDASEDVALACLEWIFAETNTFYKQHVLSSVAVESVATVLRDNVFDTIVAATLTCERCLDSGRFVAENQPLAELRDRHAARSVPQKSPEKPALATSPTKTAAAAVMAAVASASHSPTKAPIKIPKVMAEQTPARVRRRKRVEKGSNSNDVHTPAVPQLLDTALDIPLHSEALEATLWRDACLKELEDSKKKPGFTKWANVARAFMHSGQDTGPTEPDVILGTYPHSSSQGLTAIKLKSNVDSFSGISDLLRPATTVILEDEKEATLPMSASSTRLKPVSAARGKKATRSAAKAQRSTIQLNDSLSRNARPTPTNHVSSSTSQSLLSPSSSNSHLNASPTGLWRYDRHSSSSRSISATSVVSSASVIPIDELALDFAALVSSPSGVVSGVTLARGDSVLEGPERVDSPSNMSRKRFDLHQRLTMDYILNCPEAPDSTDLTTSSPPKSLPSPTTSRSGDWKLIKNYIEEPAAPVILPPSPDPLLPDALAIPRTHLATSRSVPSMRVRAPNNLPAASGSGARGNPTLGCDGTVSTPTLRQRPTTALAGHVLPTDHRSSGLPVGTSEYIREFPKPPKGVVIRARNAVQTSFDDALRVAWSN